jgi:long-chain acyl-CoA synthetase
MAKMSIDEANATLTAPGQMFEVEEIDIRGVETRIWKNCPASLRVVLDLSRGHGDKDFLIYEDERTTFEEHYRIAASIARALDQRFGVGKGDRVSIAMRNLPEWSMAFWAVASAGAVAVPLNAWWTGSELQYGLMDSGTSVVFVDAERLQRIRPHLGDLPGLKAVVVTYEDRAEHHAITDSPVPIVHFSELVADAAAEPTFPDVTLDPEDDATIFYTSGTTGKPKGAVGTHRNICTNLMSLFFINTRSGLRDEPTLDDQKQTETGDGADGKDGAGHKNTGQTAYLLSVPFFHATGCHAVLVGNTAAGGKLVLMHHWDPERALEMIERERITIFGGVPAMVMQVLDSPNFSVRDTSTIRGIAYGGAPAPPELVRRISQHFPAGSPSNGYGLTETSSITTMNNGDDYRQKPESVGPPVPVCEVAVVPEDFDGSIPTEDLPHGPDVKGELWIKGPNVVRGYWNKPEETGATFTEGWLHSGDVARIDEDGFVYIVDRAKDIVIRGGENVYSVEVEATLFEHPAVADVAVIGVPHPVLGEEVGAAVVLRPGTSVSADELALFVRDRMAGFSVPTHIWFRSEPLPRNPQGKVLKRELRDALISDPAASAD